jgi:hypothetical protein
MTTRYKRRVTMETKDVGGACVGVFVFVVSIELFWIGGSKVGGVYELQRASYGLRHGAAVYAPPQ